MTATAIKNYKLGGIHPPEKKEMSRECAIQIAPVPEVITVPLSQHIGAPCTPAVKKGDEVKKGQVIGEAGGFISAPIHAPVSGKVTAIDEVVHIFGRKVPAIVIENDGAEQWAEGCNIQSDTSEITPEQIRQKVRDSGIVGMGGATFPTHVKLSPPPEKPIDCVVINGVECEPYLTTDFRLMLERCEGIVKGIQLIMRSVNAKRGDIGIEANKPEAIEAMTAATAHLPNIDVHTLTVKYPMGAEKQVIKAIHDRDVPAGGLPMEVGVVCSNVASAYAIYEAVEWNRPLIERALTVTGEGVVNPANFVGRIGTPLEHLLNITGVHPGVNRLVLGGPMMGLAQYSADIVIAKGTAGILLLKENPTDEFRNCIRCGECVFGCPMGLDPSTLSILGESRDWEQARDGFDMMDCFECGVCSYVCPSNRPIVHLIKLNKALAKNAPKH